MPLPCKGTAYYQRSWHGVVGDHALRFGCRENAPYGPDVAPEVVVQFVLCQIEEGLDAPSRVIVVDVDGKEVADLGHVDDAAARERRLLFALVVDPFRVHRRVPVHEVERERVGLLADQVQLVALADQGPAQALDVDVAPRAREHVPVRHDQPHGFPSTPVDFVLPCPHSGTYHRVAPRTRDERLTPN